MKQSIDEEAVAQFILEHPDLFRRRPALFETIDLPDPHEGQAVSLAERQSQMLRERIRALELRVNDFVRHGRENDAIDARLTHWACSLLAERDEARLPDRIIEELKRGFDVPAAAVRIWGPAARYAALPCAAAVSPDVLRFAGSMQLPFCGPNAEFEAASWLHAETGAVRSLAMIPLRLPGAPPSHGRAAGPSPDAGPNPPAGLPFDPRSGLPFGLLVLGSPDAQRFRQDMGTAFLVRIGTLAAAGLSRLLD